RQPPRPGRAIRPHQHPSGHRFGRTATGDLGRHREARRRNSSAISATMAANIAPQGYPEEVRVHDFLIKELGRAVPYGVYDLAANSGWVSIGVDHDTAAFAVNSIRQWWRNVGRVRYPNATRLLITATPAPAKAGGG